MALSKTKQRRKRTSNRNRKKPTAKQTGFYKIATNAPLVIQQLWNEKLSPAENYKRIGITQELNKIAPLEHLFKPELQDEEVFTDVQILIANENKEKGILLKPEAPKVKTLLEKSYNITDEVRKHDPIMTEDEMTICKSLLAKHGENYQAMFRDIKLNYLQWSAGQIERKCEIYKRKYVNVDLEPKPEIVVVPKATVRFTLKKRNKLRLKKMKERELEQKRKQLEDAEMDDDDDQEDDDE